MHPIVILTSLSQTWCWCTLFRVSYLSYPFRITLLFLVFDRINSDKCQDIISNLKCLILLNKKDPNAVKCIEMHQNPYKIPVLRCRGHSHTVCKIQYGHWGNQNKFFDPRTHSLRKVMTEETEESCIERLKYPVFAAFYLWRASLIDKCLKEQCRKLL